MAADGAEQREGRADADRRQKERAGLAIGKTRGARAGNTPAASFLWNTAIDDVERIERVPIEQRVAADNTYALFEQVARQFPDKLALRYLPTGDIADVPEDYTFAALMQGIRRTANLLHALGLRPGKAVGVLAPNLPETEFLLWGGEAAGIVCPVNFYLEVEHIAAILASAGVEVLAAQGPSDFPIWPKIARIRELCPGIETVLRIGPDPEGAGILDFRAEMARQPADRLLSNRRFARDDLAACFHTGGTTGLPKITPLTHWNEVCCAFSHQAMFGFGPHDRAFGGMPLFHGGGVKMSGLITLTAGATVYLLGPAGFRNPKLIRQFWRLVEKYRCTYFAAPPTVFQALAQVPLDGADISSLEFVQVSAAPSPVEMFRAFKAHTSLDVHEAYGVTESTLATCANSRGIARVKHGSAGIRIPYIRQKIVKLDAEGRFERDCAPNEIGAIAIKSPTNFAGYLQAEANKKIWLGDGWLNSGDLGRQDEDGYFWITGRLKDLIIRGGHNIDPETIEQPLYRHPAVALCAAIGKPDAYAGEVPVVYVTLKPGAATSEAELLQHARTAIAERAAVPKEVFVVAQMPLTAVGKIHKPPLRQDAMRRALEEAVAAIDTFGARATIDVVPDAKHGMLAIVSLTPVDSSRRATIQSALEKQLSAFVVRAEIRLDG